MIQRLLFLAALISALTFTAFPAPAQEIRYRELSAEVIESMASTRAVIRTSAGEITLKFFPDIAPQHVAGFISLAREGFYDGTTFHRVIPGFMIQGGDPNSKSTDRSTHGTGGPGYRLKAEFSKRPHRRGTLSMARSRHPDSAGSQFFICVADVPHLDGQYTVFGEVTDGMAVVDRIVSQPTDKRDNPLERIELDIDVIEPEEKSGPSGVERNGDGAS